MIALVINTLVLASWATAQTSSGEESQSAPAATPSVSAPESIPPVPATPAAVESILYARKFTLEKGYKFNWCKEAPIVSSGYLLVLKVNPDLVYPRQCAEPVLYVGRRTAERLNHGYPSGHVIAIVPGAPDLDKTLIWFGTPELPERVDAERADQELTLAQAANMQPLPPETIRAAETKGGHRLEATDLAALLRGQVADLVLEYAPQEKRLADAFRVPVVERKPKPVED